LQRRAGFGDAARLVVIDRERRALLDGAESAAARAFDPLTALRAE